MDISVIEPDEREDEVHDPTHQRQPRYAFVLPDLHCLRHCGEGAHKSDKHHVFIQFRPLLRMLLVTPMMNMYHSVLQYTYQTRAFHVLHAPYDITVYA